MTVSIWNVSLICPVVSEEKMFENVDKRTMAPGVTGIILDHPWVFGRGENKTSYNKNMNVYI